MRKIIFFFIIVVFSIIIILFRWWNNQELKGIDIIGEIDKTKVMNLIQPGKGVKIAKINCKKVRASIESDPYLIVEKIIKTPRGRLAIRIKKRKPLFSGSRFSVSEDGYFLPPLSDTGLIEINCEKGRFGERALSEAILQLAKTIGTLKRIAIDDKGVTIWKKDKKLIFGEGNFNNGLDLLKMIKNEDGKIYDMRFRNQIIIRQ
jgi:hypothetical protein